MSKVETKLISLDDLAKYFTLNFLTFLDSKTVFNRIGNAIEGIGGDDNLVFGLACSGYQLF